VLSQYLDGELDARDRRALEAHIDGCARCRTMLDSLESTVHALGSLTRDSRSGIADGVIAALRAEDRPALALVDQSARSRAVPGAGGPLARGAGAALRYCLARPQLRLTVPIALAAGVVLTMVNMGGQLLAGKIDLGTCAICTADFLVPVAAVNLGLVMSLRAHRPQQQGIQRS